MFFKRPHAQLSDWGSLREIAWDDKTLGLEVPPTLLARADEVIE